MHISTQKLKMLGTALVWLLTSAMIQAQVTVSGTVTDAASKETLAGATLAVKGKVSGTISDTRGNFSLTIGTPAPFTLVISSVGYKTQEMEITGSRSDIAVALEEQVVMGEEVVVSASRVEESVMQSPVAIEKMDIRAIQQAATPNFYDALRNLKGVEVSTQSATFGSINMRGFTGNGNLRVVQLIDGMDNQAPGLNFSVGNIVGISELDLESVELLPGSASALYGPNAVNGLLLMNSKNPFNYQGLSAYAKTGLMSASNRATQTTPFYDFSVRYAKAFNNKVAFKVNASYLTAQDWEANDTRDQSFTGLGAGNPNGFNRTLANNPNYNGVNVYGDENPTSFNTTQLQPIFSQLLAFGSTAQGLQQLNALNPGLATLIGGINQFSSQTGIPASKLMTDFLLPNQLVGRTGYAERDLVNYRTSSLKLNGSLHYRLNDRVEAILQANWGTGSTVYTSSDRYNLRNFSLGQYKLEFRGSNFFVRGYTTRENSGDTYAAGITASALNEGWKRSAPRAVSDFPAGTPLSTILADAAGAWYPQYGLAYSGGAFQTFFTTFQASLPQGSEPTAQQVEQAYAAGLAAVGLASQAVHNNARAVADNGRPLPGTPGFDAAADKAKTTAIPNGGKFLDRTNLYHVEGMYNFKEMIAPELLDLIVGGNFRQYDLNSSGTLFLTKSDGTEFNTNEFGGYVQAAKTIAEKLKLTGSLRYDKNQNFKGQWTPRVSAVYTVQNNHNIRASYQTGFRIPTNQNQYINLNTPVSLLIGGTPTLWDYYQLRQNPTFTFESVRAGSPVPYTFPEFKPERVYTFELGYKGLISNKLLVDVYYYNSILRDYVGGVLLLSPGNTTNGLRPNQIISMPSSYDKDIKYQGFGIGLDYLFAKGYTLGGNLSNNTLVAGETRLLNNERNRNVLDDGFQVGFNTPKYRFNLSAGKRITANSDWGFNLTYRYQQAFSWLDLIMPAAARTPANNGELLVPAFGTLDAQVSYKIAPIKSIVKLGGSNILKNEYRTGWGNPIIGSTFYLSLTFDEFLN